MYPDAVCYRDIREFDRAAAAKSLSGVRITLVLAVGGSPCQGLSGANATKKGIKDPRSIHLYEMVRVIKDLALEKHRVNSCPRT